MNEMKRQLHILKKAGDLTARSVIETLSLKEPGLIKVVLIQDAVDLDPTWKAETFRLEEDAPLSRSVPERVVRIGYSRLIDLIFEADTVVGW